MLVWKKSITFAAHNPKLENMIWNQSIECMDREQLREIQSPDFVDASPKMAHEFFYVEKRLDHLLLFGQE